jgi:hypothetical protein
MGSDYRACPLYICHPPEESRRKDGMAPERSEFIVPRGLWLIKDLVDFEFAQTRGHGPLDRVASSVAENGGTYRRQN